MFNYINFGIVFGLMLFAAIGSWYITKQAVEDT